MSVTQYLRHWCPSLFHGGRMHYGHCYGVVARLMCVACGRIVVCGHAN